MSDRDRDVYDPVPHSHVVPAGYLRAWAHGKQIAMRQVGVTDSRLVGVRDAGVRKNFYRRERPTTGDTIYDIEWSLGEAERVALPIIAGLRTRWPLGLEDRGKVGQFFALQHLRGAAFSQWHETHIGSILEEVRANPEGALRPHPGRTAVEVIKELEATLTSDTYRLTKMLKLVRSVGIVFASMHWSLVEFARGRLVTSDHPVVVWPIRRGTSRTPTANDLDAGVTETLEVFVPVSPLHLLLMTWRDENSVAPPLEGKARQLATANGFVISNAASQWFHEPGINPWSARGQRPSLALELLSAYSASEAWRSQRRTQAVQLANAEALRELSNDPVQIVNETALPRPEGTE